MIILECLKRSRMAKHEVLERLLLRQIPDGKWVYDKTDSIPMEHALQVAKFTIQMSRARLDIKRVRQAIGDEELLNYFPELVIGYNYQKRVHFVGVRV